MSARIVFVTGTDTGAGKTVLTALSLCHLLASGVRVRAIKPFCSGSWEDCDLLRSLHHPALPRDDITAWFFKEPVAPYVAAANEKRKVKLSEVLHFIYQSAQDHDALLVEGAGGLLSPLGADFSAMQLIEALNAEVLVAARNRLGTINHTLLTVEYLKHRKMGDWKVVLMGSDLDESSTSNFETLAHCLKQDSVRLRKFPEFKDFNCETAAQHAAQQELLLLSLFD